jgi:hypothetical protein
LANEFLTRVNAPPKKPKDESPLGEQYAWREMRRRQSSRRVCVEHTTAELRQCRPLHRQTGPREDYAETHLAIASLVPDRSCPRGHPPPVEHRTGARPAGGPLINRRPTRQASAPRPRSRTES